MVQARLHCLACLARDAEFARWPALTVRGDYFSGTLPSWWQQLLSSQRREVRRIIGEVMAARGMMPLLMKVRNGGQWTPGERHELLEHLRRIAHLSPYLIFLLLPGSMLILPVYAWWLDRRRISRQERASAADPSRSTEPP